MSSKKHNRKSIAKEPKVPVPVVPAQIAPFGGGAAQWWFALVVFATTFFSFWPTLRNGFVDWDDTGMFIENVDYRGLHWANIKWMFTTFHYAHYHPITWLTFGVDYHFWGLKPMGYHLTSLIIHSLDAVLLFFLLKMLLNIATPDAQPSTPTSGGRLISSAPIRGFCCAVGALFWAIHPLRVESVAWATERRDVLSGFFYLLTLMAYLHAHTGRSKTRWLAASLAFFVLSFLSKAWGITLPVVLLILDFYPLRRLQVYDPAKKPALAPLVLEKIPYAVIALILALVAYQGQKKYGIEYESLTLLKKLAISGYALCFYLWKTVVPLNLSPLYHLPPNIDPFALKFLGCAAAAITTTLVLWLRRARWPWALAAWVCYGVIVSPVSGLVQKGDQIAADRYTYLSLLPAAVLVAAALVRLAGAGAGSTAVLPVNSRFRYSAAFLGSAVILGFLSLLTWKQTQLWHDDLSLWSQAARVEPDNAIAFNGRGRVLMDAGRLPEAKADFDRAVELKPTIVSARNNRGMIHYYQGNYDAALADFEAALKLHHQDEIYNNRGAVREIRGDIAGAIEDYSAALQLNPRHYKALFNRGRLRKQQGNLEAALKDYSAAIHFNPDYADAYLRRGDVRVQLGDLAAAIQDYSAALQVGGPTWDSRTATEQRIANARAAMARPRQ